LRLLRRIPGPLLSLCLVALTFGVAWALVTPAFQAPDENQHFAYAEYLARTGHLPGQSGKPSFSTEQREGGLASNSDQVAGSPATKMTWDEDAWHAWQRHDAAMPDALKSDAGGEIPAASNPPLYYLYEALPAKLTQGGDEFTRLAWERIFSAFWLVVLVAFAWLLAGEVFAGDRTAQFLTAATAGLLPMVQFVTASITPDAALYAVWTGALWAGTLVLKRGLTTGRAVLFLGAVGAACVVKATSYALLPGALLVLAIGAWRLHRAGSSRALLRLLAAGAALAVTLGGWFLIAHASNRAGAAQITDAANGQPFHLHDFLSYLYQYYFPRVFGMHRYGFPPYFHGMPLYDIWMRGIWGTFGWTEVRFPEWMYGVLTGITAVLVAGVVAALIRFRRSVDLAVFAFLLLTAVVLLAGLQWTDYNKLLENHRNGAFIQGRYAFPMVAVGGLGVAAAMRLVPRAARAWAIAFVVMGLVFLDLYSLGLTAWRFYA